MSNFFSGHNMANDIMRKTSLPLIMKDYQRDYNLGVERCIEHHPERLNISYETTKPFLNIPLPADVRPSAGMTVEITDYDAVRLLSKEIEERESNIRDIERAKREESRKALAKIGIYI
jgi:hypothetical protein